MKQITEKQVDSITKMLCSNIKTEKKALELYAFFEEYNINKSNESYKDLDPVIINRFNQIRKIYDYFKKNKLFTKILENYNSTIQELSEKFTRINTVWNIMNSSKGELEKYEEMKKIYKNSATLENDFKYILKSGFNDSIYDIAREALNNFDSILKKYESYESGDSAKELEILNSQKKFLENYEFAKDLITYYIESPDSYTDSIFFFSRLNINKYTFNKCLKIIEKVNPELYKKYIAKTIEDDKIRDDKYSEIIKDLTKGINTGELSDGTKFDKLEFIKRIPFKTAKTGCFIKDLTKFLIENNPEEKDTIIKYIYDNDMNLQFYFRRVYISYFYNTKTVLDDIEITNEDNDYIFDYLYLNNIPCIFSTYKIVRKKLITGEITREMIDNQKKNQDALSKRLLKHTLN